MELSKHRRKRIITNGIVSGLLLPAFILFNRNQPQSTAIDRKVRILSCAGLHGGLLLRWLSNRGISVAPGRWQSVTAWKKSNRTRMAITFIKHETMNVKELLEAGTSVSITMTPAQLEEFAQSIIDKVSKAQAQQVETYMTPDEVAAELCVTRNTLWRWARLHYLKPVRCGRRLHYKRSDVLSLLNGDKCQKKQNCNVEEKGGTQ